LIASRKKKKKKLQDCFSDLTEHWYHGDGYFFQRSDELRKLSQESLLGSCSNVKIVAIVTGAHGLPFIIISYATEHHGQRHLDREYVTCFDTLLEGGIKGLGMEDISQMLFSIAMKNSMKRTLF